MGLPALHAGRSLAPLLTACLFAASPGAVAQVETIPGTMIGSDTALLFEHISPPGAVAIDFRFVGGFAPMYPPDETHTVVVVFEWGSTDAGPWATSPDNVKTVPGGETAVFDTGVYRAAADADWVRLHFYAGDFMVVAGSFEHIAVVPEPGRHALFLLGLAALGWRLRRHHRV